MTRQQANLLHIFQGRIESRFQQGDSKLALKLGTTVLQAARRWAAGDDAHAANLFAVLRQIAELARQTGDLQRAETAYAEAVEVAENAPRELHGPTAAPPEPHFSDSLAPPPAPAVSGASAPAPPPAPLLPGIASTPSPPTPGPPHLPGDSGDRGADSHHPLTGTPPPRVHSVAPGAPGASHAPSSAPAHHDHDDDHDLHAPPQRLLIDPAELARLKAAFAALCETLGDELRAIPLYEDALSLLESLHPQPLEDLANVCNNLGLIYRNHNTLDKAEDRYLRAREILEQLRGPDHPDVATVSNNLGTLYWAWHHPEMARDHLLRALEIRRASLPADHPDIAQSESNLAAVFHDVDDLDNARLHYDAALSIIENNIADDPEHASSYHVVAENYASLLRANGCDSEAETLDKKSQRLLKKAQSRKRRPLKDPDA